MNAKAQIKAIRRQSRLATTLDEQQDLQQKLVALEKKQRKPRHDSLRNGGQTLLKPTPFNRRPKAVVPVGYAPATCVSNGTVNACTIATRPLQSCPVRFISAHDLGGLPRSRQPRDRGLRQTLLSGSLTNAGKAGMKQETMKPRRRFPGFLASCFPIARCQGRQGMDGHATGSAGENWAFLRKAPFSGQKTLLIRLRDKVAFSYTH